MKKANSSLLSSKLLVATSLVTVGLLSGCLTPAEQAALRAALSLDSSGAPTASAATDLQPSCFDERFEQPLAQISRSIDILFVMDTSGSMDDNRAKVADGISAFVSELPAEVDYRVGVMLAHGSKSSWSGKLFTYRGSTVFDSKKDCVGNISSDLKDMVLHTPVDAWGEQGEEGSYSLIKGLTTNLALNRQQGFFRTDAALAVVFVSDENDICAPYVDLPAMPGLTSAEKTIRNRDCSGGIATNTVISQVKSIQGTRPYIFGAVTHLQLNYKDSGGNDSYGYGYMEIVGSSNGVATEINDGNYTQGLSNMGKLATSKLQLILDYTLARTHVDASSIHAKVDGFDVDFTYDPISNDVHLSQGGQAASTVDLNYCLKPVPAPAPSSAPSSAPSGSPTGTPSATPSATPTPSSTPSASPTATPSATPSPSATPTSTPSPAPSATPTPSPSSTCTSFGCGSGAQGS